MSRRDPRSSRPIAARRPWLPLGVLVPILLAGIVAAPVEAASARPVIVLLEDGADVDAALGKAKAETGRTPRVVFRHALQGYAAKLTPGQQRRLARNAAVEAIVPDSRVALAEQSIPAGIRRVGATRSPAVDIDGADGTVDNGQRVDADIAIIDTGISQHPDLNVVGGVNCTGEGSKSAWSDGNGHGTHVAGTAAALDNGFGVVGTAPGARLWAVRVFRPDGYSRISWIVCGLEWVTAQRDASDPARPLIEVANLSLRDEGRDDGACGFANSDPEHRAVCRAVAEGTTIVVAAGNDRTSASLWRPAAYDEVITVSAIADYDGKPGGLASAVCTSFGRRDVDDTFADFSNRGYDIDITAPGACIRSTIPGGYGWISGTSMASPAVAGAAAAYKAEHPDATPAQVRAALRAMGTYDWRTTTDPDGRPEPLLDMRSIGTSPDYSIAALRTSASTWAGVGAIAVDVRLTRGNGYAGRVALSVEGLPQGVTATWTETSLEGLNGLTSRLTLTAARGAPAADVDLTIRGTADDRNHITTLPFRVLVDDTAPSLTTPNARIIRGQRVGPSVKVRVYWTANDAGTGLERTTLEERTSGEPWRDVALATATAASADRTIAFGTSTRYRVEARDRAGNATGPVEGPSIAPRSLTESSARTTGTWRTTSSSNVWGGRVRYATAARASATLTFQGRAIGWVATMGPTRGKARVYVDGTYIRTVDLYSSSLKYRQVVFDRAWLSPGTHTLRIVVSGTSGRPRVDVDGFVVIP